MICKSCGSEFSEQLPLCPYCAAPRAAGTTADDEKTHKSAAEISGEIAVAAKAKAEAAGVVISENLEKTKAKAEAAGGSLLAGVNGAGSAVKQKFNDAGGFKGVADKLKKFLFFILKILKIISRYVLKLLLIIFKVIKFVVISVIKEFRDNYNKPKFWVYIGIIAILILIIIVK